MKTLENPAKLIEPAAASQDDSDASPAEGQGRFGQLRRLTGVLDVGLKLGTVVVAVLAVLEYGNIKQAKRQESSFQIVSDWDELGYAQRHIRVRNAFDTQRVRVARQVENLDIALHEKAWENAKANFFSRLLDPPDKGAMDLRNDIDSLFAFYARVDSCISARICDGQIAKAFLGPEVSSFVRVTEPFIAALRAGSVKDYGMGAENLASVFAALD